MQLDHNTLQGRWAIGLGPFLSRLLMGTRRLAWARKLDAYLNYLLGRGAGAGWHLDSEIAAAAKSVFRRDPCVLDVGANLGQWSQAFRARFPGGMLYLFEPQPVCQEALRKLSIPHSELVCAAVGEAVGTARLFCSEEADSSASLHRRRDTHVVGRRYEPIDVPVTTLDRFIAEKAIPFVDFVKLDIEGHEVAALRGMADAMSANKVGALSFEFGSGNLNSRTYFRDFWDLLSPRYHLLRITPTRRLIGISAYYEDQEYFRGVTNYLAVLKDHPHAPAGGAVARLADAAEV